MVLCSRFAGAVARGPGAIPPCLITLQCDALNSVHHGDQMAGAALIELADGFEVVRGVHSAIVPAPSGNHPARHKGARCPPTPAQENAAAEHEPAASGSRPQTGLAPFQWQTHTVVVALMCFQMQVGFMAIRRSSFWFPHSAPAVGVKRHQCSSGLTSPPALAGWLGRIWPRRSRSGRRARSSPLEHSRRVETRSSTAARCQ